MFGYMVAPLETAPLISSPHKKLDADLPAVLVNTRIDEPILFYGNSFVVYVIRSALVLLMIEKAQARSRTVVCERGW